MSKSQAPIFSDFIATQQHKKIAFKDPIKNERHGLTVWANREAGKFERPTFQIGRTVIEDPDDLTHCPRVINNYPPMEGGDTNRRTLDVAIDDQDTVKSFLEWDRYHKEFLLNQSQEWFNKQLDARDIENMYQPVLRVPEEGSDLSPIVRLKANLSGRRPTKIYVAYDVDGVRQFRPGTIDDINRFDRVLPLVELSAWYFIKKECFMSFNITMMLVYKNQQHIEYTFAVPGFSVSGQSAPAGDPNIRQATIDDMVV